MPTTITMLVIIIFAILPGIPAYLIYKAMNGFDWRKNDWERITLIIGFSLLGLILYTIISGITILPEPIYVIPSTFSQYNFQIETLYLIAFSLLGHCVASLIIGIIWVYSVRFITKHTQVSALPSAWDYYVFCCIPNHWVVVTLTNDESYAGILEYTDTAVCQGERDVILREPAKYNGKLQNYEVLSYQHLYLPSNLIFSIATLTDKEKDNRINKIGTVLFQKEENNE